MTSLQLIAPRLDDPIDGVHVLCANVTSAEQVEHLGTNLGEPFSSLCFG